MWGKIRKRAIAFLLIVCLALGNQTLICTYGMIQEETETAGDTSSEDSTLIEAPSGLLMEAQTGTVIFSKDSDTKRSPASITKIMTLILIFDGIKDGSLKMTDTVTTSAYAKSMGGSQVYL